MERLTRLQRCVLFFPGTRPDQLRKAVATGADAVCLDLEDAVAAEEKDRARQLAIEALTSQDATEGKTLVRLNSTQTTTGLQDLRDLCDARVVLDGIVLPKVDSPEDVARAADFLTSQDLDVPLIASIETARGLWRAEEIACSSPSLVALLFGGVDLSTELGATIGWEELLYARSRVVHAAALAQVDMIDMPFLDVASADQLRREAEAARRLGFTGKIAIHPGQVGVIQEAFTPGEADVARARRVIEAHEAGQGGVFVLDGAMVDRPVIEAAYRTLAVADTIASPSQRREP